MAGQNTKVCCSSSGKVINDTNKGQSLWRPLYHPVEDAPLVFCDPFTVAKECLIPADRVSPQYEGEVYYVTHDPAQQWYYLNEQTPEEMALFVSYDSDPGRGPACPPHPNQSA